MKYIFDNFSGDFAAIDVPYDLDVLSGKSRSRALARDEHATGGSHSASGHHGLRLTPEHNHSHTSCYKADMPHSGTRRQDNNDESESVRRLTAGVVLVTEEVDIHFENRPPSTNGSHASFDIAYRHLTES